MVRGVLGPAKVGVLLETIKQADAKKVEWKNVKTALAKRLLKGEMQEVQAAFESEDVVNLPAGKTAWRASNAVSWIVNEAMAGPQAGAGAHHAARSSAVNRGVNSRGRGSVSICTGPSTAYKALCGGAHPHVRPGGPEGVRLRAHPPCTAAA